MNTQQDVVQELLERHGLVSQAILMRKLRLTAADAKKLADETMEERKEKNMDSAQNH